MTDHHRGCAQAVGDGRDVIDVVGDRAGAKRLGCRAVPMATKAYRQGAITLVGEEVQKVLVPAPRAMPGPMDEQQRHRMRVAARPFVDHFQHAPGSSSWGTYRSVEPCGSACALPHPYLA